MQSYYPDDDVRSLARSGEAMGATNEIIVTLSAELRIELPPQGAALEVPSACWPPA
jgi:hypothetical protein